MIRYPIPIDEIERRVNAVKPKWITQARKHTTEGTPAPSWSDIKPVFMTLQHDKCAYCERQLGSVEHGKGEFDMEHYRPKSEVKEWRSRGDGSSTGYAKLAYHLENYAVACKSCNNGLKSSYFPIEGIRNTAGDDPATLNLSEKPLLLFPIGDTVDDPRELIHFVGFAPVAVNEDASHYDNHRAQVTIDFFELVEREDLLRERCRYIRSLCIALLTLKQGLPLADGAIEDSLSAAHPHSNCLNCFKELFDTNQGLATELATAAAEWLESKKDKA